ncbi:MAG TPA: retropepsin-like aspartic protease [Kofleriaceae bacterium]|nr:retropepsin-like aspartic protease [Kofleriaceae bacterium]
MKRIAAVMVIAIGCTNPQPPHVERPVIGTGGPTITKVTPDALPVLDAWATAIGGRPALSALAAIHGKGTYEKGGVRGTIERWETARGERREDIQLGFLHETRVFDGRGGWFVDRNREVRELAGFEIDDELTLAFIGAHAALLTDRRPGTVTFEAGKLVFAPEGSKRPADVFLDPGTHLPESFARRDGDRMRTETFGDWNAVGSVKLPWTIREDNGNPNDAVTIHWKTLEAGTPPPDAFKRPPDGPTDASLAADPVVVPIEVVFNGLIFVKVTINDQPMSMVFDTGAEATVINSSRVSKLGLQALGTFATGAGGGDVVVSYVPGVTTKLGGAMVSNQIVAAVLLDQLEAPLGRPLDGILGYDFISRFVVEIDYVNQQMRLFDPARYHHTGGGKPVPVTLEDSTPFLDAAVEIPQRGKLPGHFVLDTGCLCHVQLFAPFVDSNQLVAALPDAKQAGFSAGAGGETKQVSTTIPALHIGDLVVKDPKADLSRDKTGATADPESAGLIGSLTWRQFVLVLDYKDKQVFLDPLR